MESCADWTEGDIDGVVVRTVERHVDQRGWLTEIFRADELPPALTPAMAYISCTQPGVARGPHSHLDQTDYFAFLPGAVFELRLWDNRPTSRSYHRLVSLSVGGERTSIVIVPPGIVHGYRNVSEVDGLVLNLPDRLYGGHGRNEPVDEVRHEETEQSPFTMD
jgi:dTDP-4-dehydrorhamnose 3,5-epimerase